MEKFSKNSASTLFRIKMVHVLEGLLYKFFFFKLLRLLPDTHPADPVQKKKKNFLKSHFIRFGFVQMHRVLLAECTSTQGKKEFCLKKKTFQANLGFDKIELFLLFSAFLFEKKKRKTKPFVEGIILGFADFGCRSSCFKQYLYRTIY